MGAVVNAYQNNILIGTATADKITGAFSITPTSYIAIGNQNFNIKSIDGFGNISQSSAIETSIGGVGYNQSYSLNTSSKNYTLSYRQNVSQLTDHNDGSEFNIINFNKIIFNDATIDLTIFEKASTIKMSQFEDLATIYVGYFNRAPDAEGLAYWASRLADGMSLKDISKSFFYQPETGVKYSSNLSVSDFVQNTYNYLLGRAPDTNGFNYWVNQINNKVVDRDSFVLTMINGARAATGSATDVHYLSNKADISYNFAITNGLNNVEWASDILSKVTDSLSSVSDANSQIESYANIASTADSEEFVIKLIGILP